MSEEQQPLDALDRISLEASTDEKDAAQKEQDILNPPPENPVNPAIAWAQIPRMLGSLLAIAMPELQDAYTHDACMTWGGAMAQVADKYGWDAAETMSKWAPEIALTVASLPLVLPTIAAIKKKRASGAKSRPAIEDDDDVSGRGENMEDLEVSPGTLEGGNFEKPE